MAANGWHRHPASFDGLRMRIIEDGIKKISLP